MIGSDGRVFGAEGAGLADQKKAQPVSKGIVTGFNAWPTICSAFAVRGSAVDAVRAIHHVTTSLRSQLTNLLFHHWPFLRIGEQVDLGHRGVHHFEV